MILQTLFSIGTLCFTIKGEYLPLYFEWTESNSIIFHVDEKQLPVESSACRIDSDSAKFDIYLKESFQTSIDLYQYHSSDPAVLEIAHNYDVKISPSEEGCRVNFNLIS